MRLSGLPSQTQIKITERMIYIAIYHFTLKNISRSEGRSVVAAAAYRSGEKMRNIYDGVTHDYTKKGWIEYTEIMLPENAPEKYRDRSTLWNSVEAVEKSMKCRLARECEIALPKELVLDQQIRLVQKFVRDNFIRLGMCADIAIHNPPVRDDLGRALDVDGNPTADKKKMIFQNPHAHILLTVRSMDENGKWEPKSQIEYRCKRGKEERGFTASEFPKAQLDGWEKQYRYQIGQEKIWLTKSEAANRGLNVIADRTSKMPRTTVHGRENSKTAYWNSEERVPEWRTAWENAVNQTLKELGINETIDSRSFIVQGRKEIPSVHMGISAKNMDRRAVRIFGTGSDIGELNKDIREYNDSVHTYQDIEAVADTKVKDTARILETCRGKITKSARQESIAMKGLQTAQQALKQKTDDLQQVQSTVDLVLAANEKSLAVVEKLTQLLNNCGRLEFRRKSELRDQIEREQIKISDRKQYMNNVLTQRGLTDQESLLSANQALEQTREELRKQEQRIAEMKQERASLEKQYSDIENGIPEIYRSAVELERDALRQNSDKGIRVHNNRPFVGTNLIRKTKRSK